MVEVERLHEVHRPLHGLVLRVRERVHLVAGHVNGHVQAAAAKGRHQGRGVLIDAQDHLVEIGALPPVVLKLHQHHVRLDGAGLEGEGARADGGRGVSAVVRRGDEDRGDVALHVAVWLLEGDLDGGIVQSRYLFNHRKRRSQIGVHRGCSAGFKDLMTSSTVTGAPL